MSASKKPRAKKTIVKTALTPGGELEKAWLAYLKKVDSTNAAGTLKEIIRKACKEAGTLV